MSERQLWLIGVVLSFTASAFILYYSPSDGQDFGQHYYVAAKRVFEGTNPFVLSGDPLRLSAAERGEAPPIQITGNAYLPLAYATLAPFVPLGQWGAQYAFLLVSLVIFGVGIFQLLQFAAPDWSNGWRMVAVGIALWASSTRWSSGQFQLTLATLGVICSAIRAEMIGRSWLAVILTVLATKVTLVLPIVALLLLRRKWLSVIAIGAIAGTLNLACFAWTGFEASFAGWLLNAKNYVVVNGINYQDVSTLIERTNGNPLRAVAPPGLIMFKGFEYYFYPEGTHWRLTMSALTSNKELAKLGANLLIGASGAVLAWLGWQLRHRSDDREAVSRWIIAFTCFDLVVVTHLKYDLLLFVPVCFLAYRLYQAHRLRADLALAALTFAVGFCLFSRIITTWVLKAAELRLFPLVPIYAHFATVAFGLSLYSLWRFAKTGTAHDPALAKAAVGSVPREV